MRRKAPALAKPERFANWKRCLDFALRPRSVAHAQLSAARRNAPMPKRCSTKRGSARLFQRNKRCRSKELWPESYPDPKRPAAGFTKFYASQLQKDEARQIW